MLDWSIILQAGIASGTVLLFAAIGEILAERSGVMNLGVEGMMLLGAMFAFKMAVATGNPWIGLVVAAVAAAALALLHAIVTINFQADQVVSGLAVNFVGVGLAMVLGEGLSKAGATSVLPVITIPVLSSIPVIGPILFTNHSPLVYLGYLLTPAVAFYVNRTRQGLHLRAVGEYPAAADALGINVARTRATSTSLPAARWPGWQAPTFRWPLRRAGSANSRRAAKAGSRSAWSSSRNGTRGGPRRGRTCSARCAA